MTKTYTVEEVLGALERMHHEGHSVVQMDDGRIGMMLTTHGRLNIDFRAHIISEMFQRATVHWQMDKMIKTTADWNKVIVNISPNFNPGWTISAVITNMPRGAERANYFIGQKQAGDNIRKAEWDVKKHGD